jgi:hypothetical protein
MKRVNDGCAAGGRVQGACVLFGQNKICYVSSTFTLKAKRGVYSTCIPRGLGDEADEVSRTWSLYRFIPYLPLSPFPRIHLSMQFPNATNTTCLSLPTLDSDRRRLCQAQQPPRPMQDKRAGQLVCCTGASNGGGNSTMTSSTMGMSFVPVTTQIGSRRGGDREKTFSLWKTDSPVLYVPFSLCHWY